VVNIEGNDVSSGEELVEYIGSGAPKDTGKILSSFTWARLRRENPA
jgi:hypothetical protein